MAKQTLLIIDYGSGNLRSAAKAFEHVIAEEALPYTVLVSNSAEDVRKAERIVLPGQGAFGDCIHNLENISGIGEALTEAVLHKGRPFLGICVGMQLLATQGLEHGVHQGLGWIEGQVVPMKGRINDQTLKIPHMGWNETMPVQDHPVLGPEKAEHYYFVHSFMFECKNRHDVLAVCDYGGVFPSVVGRDNILGVQFHPEKSQEAGLALMRRFMHWKP